MSHPLKHPKGKELLERVAQSFHAEDTYILPTSRIIFVCGGPTDAPSMRQRFLAYAKNFLPQLRMFLAEIAQQEYVRHFESKFQNLAEFESVIADVSNSIVMFPESPGSFTELGFFSSFASFREKLLVVNDNRYKDKDSFISLGPIELIDSDSRFGPTIYINFSKNPDFSQVDSRLTEGIPSSYRKRLRATKYEELSTQEKFFSTFEIVRLFQVLTFEWIEFAFSQIWGKHDSKELMSILAMLMASDHIKRYESATDYFVINRSTPPMLEFESTDVLRLTLEIMDFYSSNFTQIAEIVRKI